MTRIEALELRRAAVLRSVKLQRADVALRLDRLEAHPAVTLVGGAVAWLRRPLARRLAGFAVALGLKRLLRPDRARR